MATYIIDLSHSEVTFKVKHLMIASASGRFNEFNATMQSNKADFSDAIVTFRARVASITTGSEQRDAHLRGDDFFSSDKYPEITFKSIGLKKISGDDYRLQGNLTIRDITKQIELKVTYHGTIVDPWRNTRLGFEVEGRVDRHEYGLKWNAVTETGGLVVGPDVRIHANLELIKQEVLEGQHA
jgi:polyisoprenoid-binding protein YceI